ncbi:unnamed protein product [Sphagnum balticum]
MVPSTRPKYERTDVRRLALGQFTVDSIDKLSEIYQGVLDKAYRHFGIEEIKPKGSFHFHRHLLVGGRPRMIQNFQKIKRYQGVIEAIEGDKVRIGQNEIEADLVLHATGYKMNLKFLGLPLLENVKRQEELAGRTKLRCQSVDYPNLYFIGTLDSNVTLPQYAAVLSKTVVSVIQVERLFLIRSFRTWSCTGTLSRN